MDGDSHLSEWAVHQHRDTNAAVIAQGPLLSYMAIADGETRARTQFRLCEVRTYDRLMSQNMLQPCGPPPERQELI